jgi:hypothetical protein
MSTIRINGDESVVHIIVLRQMMAVGCRVIWNIMFGQNTSSARSVELTIRLQSQFPVRTLRSRCRCLLFRRLISFASFAHEILDSGRARDTDCTYGRTTSGKEPYQDDADGTEAEQRDMLDSPS